MKKVFVCFSSFVPSTSYWTTYPKQIQSSETKNPPQKKNMANMFTFSSMNVWGDKESSSRNVISSRRRKRIWMKKYGWIPLFKQDFLLYFEESSSSCMQKLHLCKLRDINLLALETIFIGILAPFMEKEQFKTFNRFNLLKESSNEGELIFDSIFFFSWNRLSRWKGKCGKMPFSSNFSFFFLLLFFAYSNH